MSTLPLLLALVLAPGPVEFPDRPAGDLARTADAIARLVADLASPDEAAREGAAARLFWAGKAARDALDRAAGGGDAELAARARGVLELQDAAARLKDVDVDFKLRGYAYAGSSHDPEALGGYADSDNAPRPLEAGAAEGREGCYLVAEPEALTVFRGDWRGMRVRLVNPTGSAVWFEASDSRISLVQQALDETGEWRDIEYLPGSW